MLSAREHTGIVGMPLEDLLVALDRSELSATEVARAYLDRTTDHEGLGAFITLAGESALAAAEAADRARSEGAPLGPLHGVPIALKDMIATRGLRTTAGSRVLADWVPDADAAVVARLRAAGAIVQGKTHATEFSVWATGGHPLYLTPCNPWDTTRVPGGSSTGSAIAVAAGLTSVALGTDTGGSVRIPAAACGVVGLKPSHGTISAAGVIPLSRSLDDVGVIARTVRDAALVLGVAQADRIPPSPLPSRIDLHEVRIGVLEGLAVPHADVGRALRYAQVVLGDLGASLGPATIAELAEARELSTAIQYPELLAYHQAGLRDNPEAYGPDLRSGCELGATITPERQARARGGADRLRAAVDLALTEHDALLLPTVGLGAPTIGQEEVAFDGRRQAVNAVLSEYTRAFNLTGHPAVSVPCGRTARGLPIGMQLVGRRGGDAALLDLAHAYERATLWHKDLPVRSVAVPTNQRPKDTACST